MNGVVWPFSRHLSRIFSIIFRDSFKILDGSLDVRDSCRQKNIFCSPHFWGYNNQPDAKFATFKVPVFIGAVVALAPDSLRLGKSIGITSGMKAAAARADTGGWARLWL